MLRIWIAMQKMLCGKETPTPKNNTDAGDSSASQTADTDILSAGIPFIDFSKIPVHKCSMLSVEYVE